VKSQTAAPGVPNLPFGAGRVIPLPPLRPHVCNPGLRQTGLRCMRSMQPSPKGETAVAAESTTKSRDLYAQVTRQIIAALEAGTRPWIRP